MKRSMLVLFLVAVACTGGEGKPRPTPHPPPRVGGEAVFGAEQWPECLNPITRCASASWTHYTVLQHVLPRAMQLDARGNFVPSPLLTEGPTLENGGLTQNPFTVRYRIVPNAVWSDGTQITSDDFDFTWRTILSTEGKPYGPAYRRDEYRHVIGVDHRDPEVAVIRFDGIYRDWPDLFGGQADYILKASAFPDADPRHPNLERAMRDSIPFSGGPFNLLEWSAGRAVLVRNERYFGNRALFDRVIFLRALTQDLEFEWLQSGKVGAIFPSPGFGSDDHIDLRGTPNIGILGSDGLYFEALWFNHRLPPLDDPLVREALMLAIDRQSVIDSLIKRWNPQAAVLNCGFVAVAHLGPWCRTRPFERFVYDPQRARSILEHDGYDCSAQFCTRNGKRLEITYSTNSANPRRLITQRLLADKAAEAGFFLRRSDFGSTLFPGLGNLALADYATTAQPDPGVTEMFGCDQIPSDTSYGLNYIGWCDREADQLMRLSDRELDPARRLALMQQVYELEARDFVSLPLYVLPAVTMWRTDQIAGPIGLFDSSPYGTFFNLNEWYLPG